MGLSKKLEFLRPRSAIARASTKVIFLFFIVFIMFFYVFYFGPIYSFASYAPEQPIPYSHKLHAGELKIPCKYCHTYAIRSEIAGIPSLKKCMNCHSNIELESDGIKKLLKYAEDNKAPDWTRIYNLPDHVWFSHKRHLAKNIECVKCHGKVETLEVNAKLVQHRMKFCLGCHQEHNAPTDCWTCHT